jgi:YbbR domain-containing protein
MKPAMRAALRFTRRVLIENLVWKVLSLLIAVVIWGMVASEPELATFATVRLEYKNLPADLEISSEPVSTVSLELRGPSGELADVALKPAVVLDMTGVQPGERTFAIGEEQVKLPRSLRMVRAIPSEARFHFEHRISRTVDVRPQFSGDGARVDSITEWRVEPPELAIVGPASHVARIGSVRTDPIDVSGLVGSAEFKVNAFVNDSFVRFQKSPQVKVAVTMKKN